MATKTTHDLSIAALKSRYAVEYGGPDKFIEALENGEIDSLIQVCADSMHAGATAPVLKQLIRNCQDKVCRRGYRDTTNSRQKNEDLMVDAFNEYLHEKLAAQRPVKAATASATAGKPAHALTPEDLAKVDDQEIMRKRINSLADYVSKHFSNTAEADLTEEERTKKAQVTESLAYARSRYQELKNGGNSQTVSISDKLASKLAKQGSTVLSASEVDELRKLLGR